MFLEEKEKQIYNAFLIAGRKAKNQPFTLRKDFSKISDKIYVQLKKLSLFFDTNHGVNYDEYFISPYKYYGQEDYYDLQFFLTSKAVKCYTLYKRQKETQESDNTDTIETCKQCCIFIYNYCKQEEITLQQYKSHITGNIPTIIQHLKDHKINFYTIHALECEKYLRNTIENDIVNFIISDYNKILNETRIKFQKSTKLKHTVRKALSIVEEKLLINNKTII